MTTQRLSSEKLFDFSFFKNITRRRFSHILVAFLVNFFTVSVPFMLAFEDFYQYIYYSNDIINRAVDNVTGILGINCFFTVLLAIYFGAVTMRYMMNRKSAHFYHALPQKRETLYITSISSALFCVAVGSALNLIIAFGELVVFQVAYNEVISACIEYLFKNFITFIMVYAVTVFTGTFSGSNIIQVLTSMALSVYPVAIYSGVIALRTVKAEYFNPNYFYAEHVLKWLSPYAAIIINFMEELSALNIVICVVLSLALLIGGLFIYRKRPIENSDKTIVFKKLGYVIKYVLLIASTVFSGLFFYAIGYSTFYLIFGFVCGAVLGLMLFNTILEKTPKAMFKGLKGFAVFALAFALFTAVWTFDVFKVDEFVPSANNISHAKIEVEGAVYGDTDFDSDEMLSALSTLLKNQVYNDKEDMVVPINRGTTEVYVDVVMYTKLGIPISRSYSISKYTEGVEEFLKLYANDPRMNEAYLDRMEYLVESVDAGCRIEMYANVNYTSYGFKDNGTVLKTYIEELGKMDYDRLSKPTVGYIDMYHLYAPNGDYIGFYDNYGYNYYGRGYSIFDSLPLYADMTKTIAAIGNAAVGEEWDEEKLKYEDGYIPSYGRIYDTSELVYDGAYANGTNDYPSVVISSENALKLRDMVKTASGYSTMLSRAFYAIDTDYVLEVVYGDIENAEKLSSKDEPMGEAVEYDVKIETRDTYYRDEMLVFPKGFVTEEIKAMFK